ISSGHSRTSRARCACGTGSRPPARHPRSRHETRYVSRANNADADLAMGFTLFGKTFLIFRLLRRGPATAYEDLYFTEHPYGLVCEVETGFPVSDSSSAALT